MNLSRPPGHSSRRRSVDRTGQLLYCRNREVIAEVTFLEGESSLAERGSVSLALKKRTSGG